MNLIQRVTIAVKSVQPRIYVSQPMPPGYSNPYGRSTFMKDFYTVMQEAFLKSLLQKR